MSRSIWATLGIPADSDRDAIRRAYAAKLRVTNPEDDPEGFMALRAAYEAALQRAASRRVSVPEIEGTEAFVLPEDAGEDGDRDESDEQDTAPHAVPSEPPIDPELEDLHQRWIRLATSLEQRWGADAALLRDLLAAPALERIALRAEIEGHVAALIADHLPKSDALVMPAIRAFGWDGRGVAARSDHAVRLVLSRAAELPQNEGEVSEAPPTGFFNRLSKWRGGGFRVWFFAAIFIINIVRLALYGTGPEPDRSRPVDEQPVAEQPVAGDSGVAANRGIPAMVPLKALPPDAGRWLRADDVVANGGAVAPTVKVSVRLSVTPAGLVSGCTSGDTEPPSRLGDTTCQLLAARAHFKPVFDERGHATARTLTMTAMWARRTGTAYAPVPVTPPREPETARRAPECRETPPSPGLVREPVPCSARETWLNFGDFPKAKLLAAGSRTLSARFEIGATAIFRTAASTRRAASPPSTPGSVRY